MLDPVERAEVAADFGVAESQVELDHFISHVLLAIAGLELPLVFFGGTALARTHLSDPFNGGRLSEDIDLYAPSRRRVASVLDQRLPQAVRREFPRAFRDPGLSTVHGVVPGQFVGGPALRSDRGFGAQHVRAFGAAALLFHATARLGRPVGASDRAVDVGR